MTDIAEINTNCDIAILDDGSEIPILGYYDHSGELEQVDKSLASQAIAGNDEVGYYCICLWDFYPVTIH